MSYAVGTQAILCGYAREEIDRITQGCHIAQPITPGITLHKGFKLKKY